MIHLVRRLLAVGVLTCVVAVMGFAAEAKIAKNNKYDTGQPIEITADTLEVMQEQQQAIFRGNVEARQGKITLKAGEMKVHYHENGEEKASAAPGPSAISRIDVSGGVLLATPEETVKGNHGHYDVDGDMVRLFGSVLLTRGKNVVKGDTLEYNLATGKSVVSSASVEGTPKGRVKGLFVPGDGKQ